MELLEQIAESCGCRYLSDMRWKAEWKTILKQMKKEDIHSCSLKEWQKVMCYLNAEKPAEAESYECVEEWIRRL